MGRTFIQASLLLLIAIAFSNISIGQANNDQHSKVEKTYEEIQVSPIENSKLRMSREEGRQLTGGRKGNKLMKQKSKNEKNGRKNSRKMKKNEKKKTRKIKKNTMQNKNQNKSKQNRKKLRKKKNKSKESERKSRKSRRNFRQNKKKSNQKNKKLGLDKKLHKQGSNKLRKSKKKSNQQTMKINALSKWDPKATCDENALCQKIKDYIKISNQLRKVRRIVKACDTMEKKANKSASEFEATVTALETAIGSSTGRRMYRSRWRRASQSDDNDDVTSIKDKLKNCSMTAKAKCERTSVAACQEEASLTKCEKELQDWLNKFGPSKGSCLQAAQDCCACITALPDVSKDCLAFDQKSTNAVNSKKKCTNGDEQGSFGFCKKLQIEAAVKGPKAACKSSSGVAVTTKAPGLPKTCHIDEDLTCCNTTSSCMEAEGYCCGDSTPNSHCCLHNATYCSLEVEEDGFEVLESGSNVTARQLGSLIGITNELKEPIAGIIVLFCTGRIFRHRYLPFGSIPPNGTYYVRTPPSCFIIRMSLSAFILPPSSKRCIRYYGNYHRNFDVEVLGSGCQVVSS